MSVAYDKDKEKLIKKNHKEPYILNLESEDLTIKFDWVEVVLENDSTVCRKNVRLMVGEESVATIEIKLHKGGPSRYHRFEISILTDHITQIIEKDGDYIRNLFEFIEQHVEDEHYIIEQ